MYAIEYFHYSPWPEDASNMLVHLCATLDEAKEFVATNKHKLRQPEPINESWVGEFDGYAVWTMVDGVLTELINFTED